MHRMLRDLAARHDSAPQSPPAQAPVRPARSEAFAAEVVRRLEGSVLRHAQRRALFGIARRLGIGRFEANLIIAAVQHERKATGAASPAPEARPSGLHVSPVALVLALETLIVWGAWRVFCG
jgi:hypothetical protein